MNGKVDYNIILTVDPRERLEIDCNIVIEEQIACNLYSYTANSS